MHLQLFMDCLLLGTSDQIGTACLLLAWETCLQVLQGDFYNYYTGFNDGTSAFSKKDA